MMILRIRTVVKKEWLVISRDRHAVAALFLMPMVFIFFLSLALQDLYLEATGRKISVVIIDEDNGILGTALRSGLAAQGYDVHQAVDTKTALAEVRVPKGAAAAFDQLMLGEATAMRGVKLAIAVEPTLDPGYRAAVKGVVTKVLYDLLLRRLGESLAQTAAGDALKPFIDKPLDADQLLTEVVRGAKDAQIKPNPLQQNVPGWSVFAMFFIATPLAGGMIRERAEGTMRRLFTLPVHRSWIVLAKLLPYCLINAIQFVLMLAVRLFVVPQVSDLEFSLGPAPFLLIPVTIAIALAATGFGVFVASFARSVEHATAITAGFAITAGVVGGIMVPVFVMPPFMQTLAHVSPLYWAHQAYLDVLVRGLGFHDLLPRLAVLLLFAGSAVGIGIKRFRWL